MSDEQDRAAWLASLKVGDEVIVTYEGDPEPTFIHVAATFGDIIRSCGLNFSRRTGRADVGRHFLRPPTEAEREAERRRRIGVRLSNFDWKGLSMPTLRAVLALIDSDQTEES